MATSLSNETSSASLVELTHSNQFSGSTMSGTSNFTSSSKTGNSDGKMTYLSSSISNSQQSSNVASSSNYSTSASSVYHKNKSGLGGLGDSGMSSTSSSYATSTSNLISSSSGIGYPFLYPNSIFQGLGQTSAASQYNYQNCSGVVGSNSMQSQQNTQTTQSNRRGGKKKAPTTQPQNPETRLFFNLRRRDAQSQSNRGSGGGSSHYYKPKNPPTVSEWFKKLTVEERVNALSTIYPHLIETFLTMHQRINEKGESYFALRERERGYMDYKSSSYNPQSYQLLQYHNFPHMLSTSSNDPDMQSFDQHFYQRVQNETELYSLRLNERDKLAAEQEILKQVRLTYYFDNLDTMTVTEDLVQDSDLFFKLMAYATNNSAFQSPSQYFFDTKNQQNLIEYPSWFKPKSFHSFATWIIVALEENLWAHYNYDNNTNLGTAKVNELSSLFRQKTDRGSQDIDLNELSKFWREMPDAEKKSLINTLTINSVKEVEQFEQNMLQSGGGYQTKSSKSGHSKSMHYSIQVKERKDQSEKSNSQMQTEQELNFYIDMSQRCGYELEMMSQLVFTKFGNTHHRQVLICKTFLDLIKKKYKDDLMENLLLEESIKQNKGSSQGQAKKKKKKNANQNQQPSLIIQNEKLGICINSDSHNSTLEYSNEEPQGIKSIQLKVPKQSKKVKNQETIVSEKQQVSNSISSTDQQISNNLVQQNQRGKKKKNSHAINQMKAEQDNQGNISLNQDSYSCDEQPMKSITKKLDIQTDIKSQSNGQKSQSTMGDNTTAHQSNNSNSNSSATITSNSTPNNNNAQNILQIQSSKSLDLNTLQRVKQPQSTMQKLAQKSTSKVESKNYQILQQSHNEQIERRNSKNEKRNKNMINNQNHNNYTDNIIFSEDDRQSKKLIHVKDNLLTSESENESMEVIRQYVLELTNDMINQVCMQSERDYSKSSQRETEEIGDKNKNAQQQSNDIPEYFKLGAAVNGNTYNNQRKKSYYKKTQHNQGGSRKQSSQLQAQENDYHQNQQNDKRKISFNTSKKCFKDDKKFSEDFADSSHNISNNSHHQQKQHNKQQSAAVSSGGQNQMYSSSVDNNFGNEDSNSNNGYQHRDSYNNSKPHRKGFGIHLKQFDKNEEARRVQPQSSKNSNSQSFFTQPVNSETDTNQAWAKGTVKQPETFIAKQQNKTANHQSNNSQNPQSQDKTDKQSKKQDITQDKPRQPKNKKLENNQQSDTQTIQDDNNENDGQKNKKKRNRKKNKLNDIDIMNNFMKNLQASQDEVKSVIDSKNQPTYKKRVVPTPAVSNGNNQQVKNNNKRQGQISDTQSVQSENQSYQTKNNSQSEYPLQNDQTKQIEESNLDNQKSTTSSGSMYKQRLHNKPPQTPQLTNFHDQSNTNVKSFQVSQKLREEDLTKELKQRQNENIQDLQHESKNTNLPSHVSQVPLKSNHSQNHHKSYQAKQTYPVSNSGGGDEKQNGHNLNKGIGANHYKNSYQYNNNKSQGARFQKHQSHNQKIVDTKNEDLESVHSNVADCVSDKSSKSMNEKNFAKEGQTHKTQNLTFKYMKSQGQQQDIELGSQTDNTGTTNTAADTSIENYANQYEESKDPIVIQDQEQQSSQIQISLTDSIDASNLFKNNAFAYSFQQFSNKIIESTMQQTLHEIQETSTIPPQLQSPTSQNSSQAAIFTPQCQPSSNYQNQINNLAPSNFEHLEKNSFNNSYQSFQNTPQKSQPPYHNNKNAHKNQTIPLSAQVSSNSQESLPNYRTPPQISKKNSVQYNHYSNNITYRKANNAQSQNNANQINHHNSNHVGGGFAQNNSTQQQHQNINQTNVTHQHANQHGQKNNFNMQPQQFNVPLQQFQQQNPYNHKDFFQPQPKQNMGFIPQQQMPLQGQLIQEPQFIHQYNDPNMMFYGNQQMYIPGAQMMDTYNQRAQENVFQYVEKQIPIHNQMPQPMNFYPTNQVPMPNFSPVGIIPPNDPGFNFQKRQPQPYYDQGQDLIMQIFNSIKFNQQSLSPIPQCISSPPPLVEMNSAQAIIDGTQISQKSDSSVHSNNENAFYEKFDQDIARYIQSVHDTLNMLKPERDFVFNKILQTTREVFAGQNPALQLFGSLVTGLALESSDMDLAVTGLYIEDRYAVICELNKLSGALQDWDILESFKSIETASIPVIKMKVDLYQLREKEMKNHGFSDFDLRPIPEELRYFSVDITFDDSSCSQMMNQVTSNIFQQDLISQLNITKTHLGLQSCSLVQFFIANYQNLKEVSILLKRFLALNNFNSPYYGGISSYSAVILLVAYMNYFDLKGNHNLSPSRLLMGFLDFYGNFFNASTWGVNIYNEGSFYHLNGPLDSNIVILDPLNLSNNTSRNSYLTKEILQKFQQAFNNLKSLTLKTSPQSNNAEVSSQTSILATAGFTQQVDSQSKDLNTTSNITPQRAATVQEKITDIVNMALPDNSNLTTQAQIASTEHTTIIHSVVEKNIQVYSSQNSVEFAQVTLQNEQLSTKNKNSQMMDNSLTSVEIAALSHNHEISCSQVLMIDDQSSNTEQSLQNQKLFEQSIQNIQEGISEASDNKNKAQQQQQQQQYDVIYESKEQLSFISVNLLETFFAIDSQPATATLLSRNSSAQ